MAVVEKKLCRSRLLAVPVPVVVVVVDRDIADVSPCSTYVVVVELLQKARTN